MTQEILRIPSTRGQGENDFLVLAPEGLGVEQAKQRIEEEIRRVKGERDSNSDTGLCDDALSPQGSLMNRLGSAGFTFVVPTTTCFWDGPRQIRDGR
jgi:hypothetical protein